MARKVFGGEKERMKRGTFAGGVCVLAMGLILLALGFNSDSTRM